MGKKKPAPLAFCFGDPEPVLSGAVYEYLGVWLLNNGRYYATPVPWSGLARLLRANAYHGPILEFKTNMAMRGFRASAALTRRDMHAVATDYMVFANAYLLLSRNWLGEVAGMRHLPAINMRRMKEPDRYGLLLPSGQFHEFGPGEVLHLKNYDVASHTRLLSSHSRHRRGRTSSILRARNLSRRSRTRSRTPYRTPVASATSGICSCTSRTDGKRTCRSSPWGRH